MPQPDYQNLASSFLDMWQEQIARSLTDRDFIRKMMDLMQQQPASPRGRNEQAHRHAAAASSAESGELYDLRQRLSACERRIRTLEAALEAATKPKPRKKAAAAKKHAKARTPARARAGSSRKAASKPAAARPKAVKRAVKRKPARKRRLS